MKHLIIYAHPNPESLNSHIKDFLTGHLAKGSHEVEVRDLYTLNFNPVLSRSDMAGQRKGSVADDVRVEQKWISWAEHLTFIYPIWWTGLPAIMKGYIDRVFSYGFAYRYTQGIQEGLLKGKETVVINTHGKSADEYHANHLDQALSLTSDTGIYTYSGLQMVRHFFFDKADKATAESISSWESELKTIYTNS